MDLSKEHLVGNAFVIGNGISRKEVDLTQLKGFTIGCNALYRDFSPDILVAMDPKMQKEIVKAGYHEDHVVYFKQHPHSVPDHPNIIKWKHHGKAPNNSGIAAIWFALKLGYRPIYLIGMDGTTSNVYANSPNYSKPTRVQPTVLAKLKYLMEHNEIYYYE